VPAEAAFRLGQQPAAFVVAHRLQVDPGRFGELARCAAVPGSPCARAAELGQTVQHVHVAGRHPHIEYHQPVRRCRYRMQPPANCTFG
jgi:hypothetical protein